MGLAINDPGKEKSVAEMMDQRIGDYEAFLEFQRLVFEATEHFVATIEPSTFSDIVVGHPYGADHRPDVLSAGRRRGRVSREVTPSSAGSTSTHFVTWARSSTPGPSSAYQG